MSYKIQKDLLDNAVNVKRDDGAFIPFDQTNGDCRKFLSDWKAGIEVKDATDSVVAYSDAAVTALNLDPTNVITTPAP